MTKRTCWTAAVCLGLMLLSGGFPVGATDLESEWAELEARMTSEGWAQIEDGVFERQLGPDKVEHMGYGQKGLAWMVGNLERKLEHLREEYGNYPSEELADVIDELSVTAAKARRELGNQREGLSSVTAAVAGASCGNICYAATADAYYLTSTQGVAATASAKFNSTCGYSGDTYAYAYARATAGTTTTTKTQSDPRTGTNVTSSATATANGGSVSGIPCYSEASSWAQSTALGISYSTSDTNTLCPIPPNPLSAAISGVYTVTFTSYSCKTVTWSSSVSGGTSPYIYRWYVNGAQVGTTSSYSRTVCPYDSTFTLELLVWDYSSPAQSDTDSRTVNTYYYEDPGCGGEICL